MSFPNDEGASPSREHKNPKYHALNNKALKYTKWKLIQMQREIDKSLIIARDFNTPPSIIYRINRERKANEGIESPDQHYQPSRPTWHLENTAPNKSGVHVLFTVHLAREAIFCRI